ncbi:hypothetical protein GXM_07002 [Nostoc sphaeroides CCNUC1]|uniref:Uncharacterized protein n=1 Tax=Nostoc sphaeroides CCNUC1 TaxID=2653204 RepID=A0A5P8W9S6_9NOSO|nr:hypothetical protein GXM_07002 [Nostoc sphaeroides CCNUC1]
MLGFVPQPNKSLRLSSSKSLKIRVDDFYPGLMLSVAIDMGILTIKY